MKAAGDNRAFNNGLINCRSLRIPPSEPWQPSEPKPFEEDEPKVLSEGSLVRVKLRYVGWEVNNRLINLIMTRYEPIRFSIEEVGGDWITFAFDEVWKATYFYLWGPTDKTLMGELSQVIVRWDDRNNAPPPAARDEDVDRQFPLEIRKPLVDPNVSYFRSYSRYGIHRVMLQDTMRVQSYKEAMDLDQDHFRNSMVMDIGCGTGILSLLAAKTGASTVIALDNSAIVEKTIQCIKDNHFQGTIRVFRTLVEDFELDHYFPETKVDAMISEWMGYCLIYERMLPTVLMARDKWLAPTGRMYPNRARVFVSGFHDAKYVEKRLHWTRQPWRLNCSPLTEQICRQVIVQAVPSNCVVSDYHQICDWDLESLPVKSSYIIESDFELQLLQGVYLLHGLVVHFDLIFDHGKTPVILTTSPDYDATHWKHSLLPFPTPVSLAFDDKKVRGRIRLETSPDSVRSLTIKLTLHPSKSQPGCELAYTLK